MGGKGEDRVLWIMCEERMPEIDVPVSIAGGRAVWRGGHWDSLESGRAIEWEVTHWRPLPRTPTTISEERP